jgi:hypothetical protein
MRKYQLPITKEEIRSAVEALISEKRRNMPGSRDAPIPTHMTASKLRRWFIYRDRWEEAAKTEGSDLQKE